MSTIPVHRIALLDELIDFFHIALYDCPHDGIFQLDVHDLYLILLPFALIRLGERWESRVAVRIFVRPLQLSKPGLSLLFRRIEEQRYRNIRSQFLRSGYEG